MMAVLIGANLISAMGWFISLAWPHSAVRRHLMLMTALVACLLLPLAVAVRQHTTWTSVSIPVAATRVTAVEARTAADGALPAPVVDTDAREPRRDVSLQVVGAVPTGDAPSGGLATREPQTAAIADKPAAVDGARRTDWWNALRIALSSVYLSVAFALTRAIARPTGCCLASETQKGSR